jgi:hypothetical protein
MKARVIVLGMLMMLLLVARVEAQEGFGLGVIVGEPTGISFKKWLNKEHAIDAAAAWSFSENDSFQFHADYLFHNFSLLKTGDIGGRLPLYVGVGGRVKLEGHDHDNGRNRHDALVGVRVPFGISFLFNKVPVDLFAEIVPILDVAPDTDFDINGAIGARFYFR